VDFHRIEDHGVTLLTVVSWRGDLVSIKYISSFLIKKNVTNINEAIFFYMRQPSTKCQWRIEKPLKFTGRFGYGRNRYRVV
jgi:hypothetical protein